MSQQLRTLFVDTQGLIYAFEANDPVWLDFIDSRLAAGYRLVLAEEQLYEFGQSGTLEAALTLTRQAVQRHPLWLRSFADLKAEEVCRFARNAATGDDRIAIAALVNDFEHGSQLARKHKLGPEEFVYFAFDSRTREGIQDLARQHADVVDELSQAVARGQLTRELNDRAVKLSLRSLLSRGSVLVEPATGGNLDDAVKHCFKHRKRLMRECPAYATEYHMADYRSSSPKRRARLSDSKDLMLAVAAFPYVSTFATNDGYLHGALRYVQSRAATISTELLRRPPTLAT